MIDADQNPVEGYMGDAVVARPSEPRAFDEAKVRFGNNPLSGALVTNTYESSALRLHGDRSPALAIVAEKPEHRMMVYLKLQGKSNREIAEITGYTPTHVNTITKQPWFRLRFTELAQSIGKDEVEGFLKSEVLNSLEVLRTVRDSDSSPANAKIAAANSILDRHLGKPVQKIESKTALNVTKATNDAEAIDRELADLQRQLGSRGVN